MDFQSTMTSNGLFSSHFYEMLDQTSQATLEDLMVIIHREYPELTMSDCQAKTFAAHLSTNLSCPVKAVAIEEGSCLSQDMMDLTSDAYADVARDYDNNLTTSMSCGEMSSLWSPTQELCLPHERVESVGTGGSLDPVIGVFASLSLECLPPICR